MTLPCEVAGPNVENPKNIFEYESRFSQCYLVNFQDYYIYKIVYMFARNSILFCLKHFFLGVGKNHAHCVGTVVGLFRNRLGTIKKFSDFHTHATGRFDHN